MEDDVDGVRVQNKTCTWKISWKIRMEEYFTEFGWQFPTKFLCSTCV